MLWGCMVTLMQGRGFWQTEKDCCLVFCFLVGLSVVNWQPCIFSYSRKYGILSIKVFYWFGLSVLFVSGLAMKGFYCKVYTVVSREPQLGEPLQSSQRRIMTVTLGVHHSHCDTFFLLLYLRLPELSRRKLQFVNKPFPHQPGYEYS